MDDEQQVNDDLDAIFDAADAGELEQPQETEVQEEQIPPVDDEKPEEAETSETPPAEPTPTAPQEHEQKEAEEPKVEEPKPLTLDDIRTVITDVRQQEQDSYKTVETFKKEILDIYLPDGLPEVVTDENGNKYHSAYDVIKAVEAKGGEISRDEAEQWLANEQYKLQKSRQEYIDNAQNLAEVNANFRNGSVRVLDKYGSLFDKFPEIQQKVYKNYMKAVKWDSEKDIVLSAPDIEEYYSDYLEPYMMAFQKNLANDQQATPPEPKQPVESKPSIEDRLDETGDGGSGKMVDKNNPDEVLDDLFGNG